MFPKVALFLVAFGCLLHSLNAADQLSLLLKFKSGISDPLGHLQNWGKTPNYCSWSGVACDSSSFITGLELQSRNLSGEIDSTICSLPRLTKVSLRDNNFTETFPFGNCKRLVFLDLGVNSFFGQLPDSISGLHSLQYLELEFNDFTGPIPDGISNLTELRYFSVWSNFLTMVPPSLGNLPNLANLTLSYNPYRTGLPEELRNLSSLQSLKCGGCQLTGSIPEWLGELKSLDFLELTFNSLTGVIPTSIMYLPKLTSLELYSNMLSGPIPDEISNLVSLTDLDLNSNSLNGTIPQGIAQIPRLGLLHLWNNSLTGRIPEGLSKLANLYDLSLFANQLTGSIPSKLGLVSRLEIFDVSTNLLTGPVPTGLCTGGRLWKLILFNNSFTGEFPSAYESCKSLIRVRVYGNSLSGELPSGIWGLPQMTILEIYSNRFSGPVSPKLGQAAQLQTLRIHDNLLSGELPEEISNLHLLDEFTAYGNNLSGTLPSGISECSALSKLLLGSNSFQGDIPGDIGKLANLKFLDLSNNGFSGSIPKSIGSMASLISLDLSRNKLTGDIPTALSRLKVQDFVLFNMSYNDLSGKVPSELSMPPFDSSFIGNPRLQVAEHSSVYREQRKPGTMAWIAGAVLASAAALSAFFSYLLYKRCHEQPERYENEFVETTWTIVPFQKLSFTVYDIVNSLEEENVIGRGGAGKVYRVTLNNGTNEQSYLAVKKLWGCEERRTDLGFKTEVEILGRIRHFNIVKLLCCCSNGRVNLLVYEYVPNGSLGDVLHSSSVKVSQVLDWPTRYRIAVGAAQGLSYLHHDCVPQILHRDIKSNNILLSDEYDALLADFGLAKLVGSSSADELSMSVFAGSHGYIAPEYAHRMKVNDKSDVYSFGVVLLELVTGKRAIGSPEFGENGDIVTWVRGSIRSKQGVSGVVDPCISASSDVLLVLKIGLRCTAALSASRPSMREVIQMLTEAEPGSSPTKAKSLI